MDEKSGAGLELAIYLGSAGASNHHLACVPNADQQDSNDSYSDRIVQNGGVKPMTVAFDELRKKWHEDPEFRKEYDALRPEFRLARELIEARTATGLSRGQARSSAP